MLGFQNVSVRTRLFALVALNALGLVGVMGVAAYAMYTFRVGGPVAEQLANVQEFRSRISPATLYIRGAYVTCQEIADETGAAEVARLAASLKEHEAAFIRDYNATLAQLADPEVRNVLVTDLYPATNEFFRTVRDDFLPLVGKPDQKALDQALYQRVKPAFNRHAAAAERIVAMAQEAAAAEERAALAATHFWSRVMLAVGGLCLAVMLVVGWVVVNGMVVKTQGVVDHVRESCLSVLSAASQIAATARQQEATVAGLNEMTTQVAAAVREITATGNVLSGTVGEVNDRANQAAALAAAGREGLGGMERTMTALVDATASVSAKLTSIREKADTINLVVTTITKVADQTNLLSINAAIEAEKAGEYGRGFLVIAREIRRLADQTAVATLDIEGTVGLMQTAVAAGVMQMDKFTDEVRNSVTRVGQINAQTGQIIAEVGGLSDRFEQVNTGMRDQQVGAGHINEAMGSMTENIRRTAASLVEFNSATAQLRESIAGLNNQLAAFKV